MVFPFYVVLHPLSPGVPGHRWVLQRRCVLAALRTSADREAMRSVEAEVWAHLGVAMQRLGGVTENSGTIGFNYDYMVKYLVNDDG